MLFLRRVHGWSLLARRYRSVIRTNVTRMLVDILFLNLVLLWTDCLILRLLLLEDLRQVRLAL